MDRSTGRVAAGLGLLVLAVGGTVVALVAALGGPDEVPVVVRDPGPTAAAPEPMVTCGGDGSWPASVMADGAPGVWSEAEARATFRQVLEDPGSGPEAELSLFPDGVDAVRWRAFEGGPDRVTVGLGDWTVADGPGDDAMVLTLVREGERWMPSGWGTCHLTPVPVPAPDASEVEVTRVVGSSGRELVVLVNERQCAGARDPLPYLHSPVVVETADTITLTWTSDPVRGAATCPGNPSVEQTVQLAAPLDDRTVLDGSTYPARAVPLG